MPLFKTWNQMTRAERAQWRRDNPEPSEAQAAWEREQRRDEGGEEGCEPSTHYLGIPYSDAGGL